MLAKVAEKMHQKVAEKTHTSRGSLAKRSVLGRPGHATIDWDGCDLLRERTAKTGCMEIGVYRAKNKRL